MEVEMEEDRQPFLGEVKPHYGRWTWPLSWMKPGEFFIVDHARRDPEAVRNYVSMRAAQLNKRFSVQARDPEHHGYCRVICVPFDQGAEEPKSLHATWETAKIKLSEWYSLDIDQLPFSKAYQFGEARVAARQLREPPVQWMTFDAHEQMYMIGMTFELNQVRLYAIPRAHVANWKPPEPLLDEVMQ